jgi:hypothetical protein
MTYRYPWRAMLPDYVRATLGMACTITPLIVMQPSALVAAVLIFLAVIFTLFALQVALRHATRILVSANEIRARPLGARLAWDGLTRLKLAYFSVRRDGRDGWMELKIQSGGSSLRVDSRLDGFTDVVRQAAAAASHACLELDASTLSNLQTLGIGAGVAFGGAMPMREHG